MLTTIQKARYVLVVACVTAAFVVAGPPRVSAAAADSPIGNVDAVRTEPTVVHVQGWALDPDDDADNPTHTVAVDVYLDGVLVAYDADAAESRPDVGTAHGFGDDHGFDLTFPWTGGAHQICVGAINAPGTPGADVTLGCTMTTGSVFGNLEFASWDNGHHEFKGWAIDPDTTAPTAIAAFYVRDGVPPALVAFVQAANLTRADVGAANPGYGDDHGFDLTFDLATQGKYFICLAAQNVSETPGADAVLGCVQFDAGPHLTGSLDTVEQTDLGLRAIGWIVDLDTTSGHPPIAAFIDGTLVGYLSAANGDRPDVDANTPFGPDHGFDLSFNVAPGTHQLCLTSQSVVGDVPGTFVCVDVTKLSLK